MMGHLKKGMRNHFAILYKKLAGSRLRLNIFSGFFATGLGIFVTALKYPLYLHFLDYEIYGTWLILATLIGMAQLGMLGIGPAITKLIAEELGRENIPAIEKYTSTAVAILIVSGLVVISFILFFKLEILNLLGLHGTSLYIGNRYLPYICLLTFIVFIYQAINATVAGMGRIDISNYSQTAVQTLPLMIAIPMLVNDQGVLSLLVGDLTAYLLISLTNIHFITKKLNLTFFSFTNISNSYLKKLIVFGVPVFGSSVAMMFFFPITKIVISNYVGLSAVPIYEVASRAANQILALFNMGFKALMPELSRLSSLKTKKNKTRSDEIKRKAYRLIVFGGGGLCLILFLMAPHIFSLWLGKSYLPNITAVFRVLVVGIFFNMFALVDYYNILALGRTKIFFLHHLIASITSMIALTICFVMLSFSSLLFAAISNTIGFQLAAVYLIIMSNKIKREDARHSVSKL